MIEAIITPPPFYGYTINDNGVVLNPKRVVEYKGKGLSVTVEVAQIYPSVWCGDVHVTRSGEGKYYGCGGPITVRDKQNNLRTTIYNCLTYVADYLTRNDDKALSDKFLEEMVDKY